MHALFPALSAHTQTHRALQCYRIYSTRPEIVIASGKQRHLSPVTCRDLSSVLIPTSAGHRELPYADPLLPLLQAGRAHAPIITALNGRPQPRIATEPVWTNSTGSWIHLCAPEKTMDPFCWMLSVLLLILTHKIFTIIISLSSICCNLLELMFCVHYAKWQKCVKFWKCFIKRPRTTKMLWNTTFVFVCVATTSVSEPQLPRH
jgi:hypothetical protein